MEKFKWEKAVILVVILVLMLGSANKLKTGRTISLTGDVTGSASFDGSKNVSINADLANIVVLTGTINVTKGSGNVTVNYPNGYNNTNCIVLYAGVAQGTSTSVVLLSGVSGDRTVGTILFTSNIRLYTDSLEDVGPTGNLAYKIVLMKI